MCVCTVRECVCSVWCVCVDCACGVWSVFITRVCACVCMAVVRESAQRMHRALKVGYSMGCTPGSEVGGMKGDERAVSVGGEGGGQEPPSGECGEQVRSPVAAVSCCCWDRACCRRSAPVAAGELRLLASCPLNTAFSKASDLTPNTCCRREIREEQTDNDGHEAGRMRETGMFGVGKGR